MELRSSNCKLNPLPPDPFRHQDQRWLCSQSSNRHVGVPLLPEFLVVEIVRAKAFFQKCLFWFNCPTPPTPTGTSALGSTGTLREMRPNMKTSYP